MIFNLIYGGGEEPEPSPTPTPTPTSLVLYDSGNEKPAASGGWGTFAPAWGGSTGVMYEGETASVLRQNPVGCSKEAEDLKIYWRNPNVQQSFANGAFVTLDDVNLSDWTTLHVKATKAESTGGIANYHVFGVVDAGDLTPPTDGTNTPPGTYKTLGVGETTLDVSAISAARRIYIGGMLRSTAIQGSEDRHVHIVVTKVWLT